MAHKILSGVTGVLGDLISNPATEHSTPAPPAATALPIVTQKTSPSQTKSKLKATTIHSRLGRPPGRNAGVGQAKEKITVRMDAALIAAYRDWSWESRCQVGELMEKALRQFIFRRQGL